MTSSLPPLSIWKPVYSAPRGLWKVIAIEIAEECGIGLSDLLGRSHARRFAWPRQRAYAEVYERTHLSTTQIGKLFGGRDHSTIVAGRKAHAKRLAASFPQDSESWVSFWAPVLTAN